MKFIKKQCKKLLNKLIPLVERFIKWSIAMALELFKLASVAYVVLALISATQVVEAIIAGLVVFITAYFAKAWK